MLVSQSQRALDACLGEERGGYQRGDERSVLPKRCWWYTAGGLGYKVSGAAVPRWRLLSFTECM